MVYPAFIICYILLTLVPDPCPLRASLRNKNNVKPSLVISPCCFLFKSTYSLLPLYYIMMGNFVCFKISGIGGMVGLNPSGPCQVVSHRKLIFLNAITAVVLFVLSSRYAKISVKCFFYILQSIFSLGQFLQLN